jgi:hypothetical protein
MKSINWKKAKHSVDERKTSPLYFLDSEDLFVQKDSREVFIQRIFSSTNNTPKYGTVVLCPGLSTNANLFRVDNNGRCFDLDHNLSFANLLASEGFDVYLYHPGYCERIFNRYVRGLLWLKFLSKESFQKTNPKN